MTTTIIEFANTIIRVVVVVCLDVEDVVVVYVVVIGHQQRSTLPNIIV